MNRQIAARSLAREALANPELQRPDWLTGSPRDPRLLWLVKNENSDPALAEITTRVLREVVDESLHVYPESAALYQKLGDWVGVSPDHLLLTAGSDGVIRAVFETFVNPGDAVLLTEPTFAMYPVYAKIFGAQAHVMAYEATDSGPQIACEAIVAQMKRVSPKLVCLPNPDSPTGTILAPEEVRLIADTAGELGAILLIDEAYHPFYSWSAVPWVRELPHLVVARTFSKAWGLAGLRAGYAVAHPQTVQLLHLVRPMYEVNTLAVAAVERMLDHAEAMEASVERLRRGVTHFLDAMTSMGLPTLDSHGNFLHVAFGDHGPAVHAALAPLVLYRPYSSFPVLTGYSRFSATTAELFDPLIERIRGAIH